MNGKTLTNVTGPNVVNSVVGIILLEQKKETRTSAKQPQPMLDRSKEQSLKPDRPIVLPPKTIYKQTGPVFPEATVLSPPPANDKEYLLCAKAILRFVCW